MFSVTVCSSLTPFLLSFQHGTTDWFQIRKGVHQCCVLSPSYLTYMQSTSWEMLDWMKHKLEPRLPREISITSDMQIHHPSGRKWRRIKEPLDESEGDDRGWDGWMASPTQWIWVCVNSGSWWWTGRPAMLWFMGSQRVGHDWVTELKQGE